MQFLTITKPSGGVPPIEMVPALLEAHKAWLAKHRASGRITAVWFFAGEPAGAGIAEVESAEQLDELFADFPWGPWSFLEHHALSDPDAAIDTYLAATKAQLEMMQQMQG